MGAACCSMDHPHTLGRAQVDSIMGDLGPAPSAASRASHGRALSLGATRRSVPKDFSASTSPRRDSNSISTIGHRLNASIGGPPSPLQPQPQRGRGFAPPSGHVAGFRGSISGRAISQGPAMGGGSPTRGAVGGLASHNNGHFPAAIRLEADSPNAPGAGSSGAHVNQNTSAAAAAFGASLSGNPMHSHSHLPIAMDEASFFRGMSPQQQHQHQQHSALLMNDYDEAAASGNNASAHSGEFREASLMRRASCLGGGPFDGAGGAPNPLSTKAALSRTHSGRSGAGVMGGSATTRATTTFHHPYLFTANGGGDAHPYGCGHGEAPKRFSSAVLMPAPVPPDATVPSPSNRSIGSAFAVTSRRSTSTAALSYPMPPAQVKI